MYLKKHPASYFFLFVSMTNGKEHDGKIKRFWAYSNKSLLLPRFVIYCQHKQETCKFGTLLYTYACDVLITWAFIAQLLPNLMTHE